MCRHARPIGFAWRTAIPSRRADSAAREARGAVTLSGVARPSTPLGFCAGCHRGIVHVDAPLLRCVGDDDLARLEALAREHAATRGALVALLRLSRVPS